MENKIGIYSRNIIIFEEKYPIWGIVVLDDNLISEIIKLDEN